MFIIQKLLANFETVKDFLVRLRYPVNEQPAFAIVAHMSVMEGTYPAACSYDNSFSVPKKTQTDDDPKKRVFDHWHHIEAIAERRFPNDKNLQLEATQYVLDALEANGWKKVRAFKGNNFTAFLTTVTSNLLTDFWHKKFGKKRPNRWLTRQTDPIYQVAYRLLVKDRYSKRETTEILLTTEPKRERWFIQEVVDAVLANCPLKEEYQEISLNDPDENYTVPQFSLETQIEWWNEQALLEILDQSLNSDTINNPLNKFLAQQGGSVRLTEEECLLLRLRYQSGLTARKIGTLLDLSASQVDKRIKKTQARLRKALCRR
jgi:RNA polymerase sigma factor (sigma-70 family)